MGKVMSVYKRIGSLRERYYQSARNKDSLLKLINEAEVAEQVYNSNAIENSTLSLEETEKILLHLDLDRYVSELEVFEARNLARVVTYIDTKAKQQELNLEMILLLHRILITNIHNNIAGRFRKNDEWVRVANHIACDTKQIIGKLEDMFIKYNSSVNDSIIKRIAVFHLSFEHIHPFVDGNGRIGRVLNNYLLIREGYVPINIKLIDRTLYYDAFEEFDRNISSSIMEEIVGKAITNSYHKRLAYLDGMDIITLNEYAKQNNLSHSNLINKAKRQTIEAFLEKGLWKIGDPTS
ncbi:MAG: Fic family protein [Candidatus Aegiribacteria sp.]|nr:Fic family protein [Candidatus Aegiribacteria sp.]